jgi:hypothetical protein
MNERIAETSPQVKARIAGAFYLLVFLVAGGGFVLGGGLVVSGDAATTAANVLAHEASFRLAAIAADVVGGACYVVVTVLFYELFKPVNRSLSLLAAFFSLVGCAVGAFSAVLHLSPLYILGGVPYLSVFTAQQLEAAALMLLKLYGQTQNIALVFFGFYCLLIGYLIFKSTFLPRVLGLLMAFAGLGWLTNLWAPLASSLFPYNVAPGLLGEGALTLWLLTMGVNAQRWNERAGLSLRSE